MDSDEFQVSEDGLRLPVRAWLRSETDHLLSSQRHWTATPLRDPGASVLQLGERVQAGGSVRSPA